MLSAFMSHYLEWQGVRKDLPGPEKRRFERWLARTKPELLRAASGPAAFRLQCIEVRHMFVPRRESRIGPAGLAKHAEALMRCYRVRSRNETYQSFLNRALAECATPGALARFITREGSSDGS